MVERILHSLGDVGWLGVQLFFVLSGFLITGILLDERNTDHSLRNFYMRRALRIFPLYYVALIIFLVSLPLLGVSVDGKKSLTTIDVLQHHALWHWMYLSNWGTDSILPCGGV